MTALSEMTPHTIHFLGLLFGLLLALTLAAGILIALFRTIANDGEPSTTTDVAETLGIGENTTSWVRGKPVAPDADDTPGRHRPGGRHMAGAR